jgi:ribonucleotide reductase beta subunit family protein with ferritin-like domain
MRKDDAIRGIQYRELRHKIVSLRDQFVEDNLPADFRTPLEMEESELDPQETIFVRQLELVSLHRERIRQAIGEYYRAYRQRSRWARDGLIVDEDLEEYEVRLRHEWKDYFLRMKENLAEDADESCKVKEGRKLYNMIRDQVDEYIKPKFNEAYHQRGSYHMLANELEIGWHSDFIQRLQDIVEEAENK